MTSTAAARWRYATFTEAVRLLYELAPFDGYSWWWSGPRSDMLHASTGADLHREGCALLVTWPEGTQPNMTEFIREAERLKVIVEQVSEGGYRLSLSPAVQL